jgi:hypothetical protein
MVEGREREREWVQGRAGHVGSYTQWDRLATVSTRASRRGAEPGTAHTNLVKMKSRQKGRSRKMQLMLQKGEEWKRESVVV